MYYDSDESGDLSIQAFRRRENVFEDGETAVGCIVRVRENDPDTIAFRRAGYDVQSMTDDGWDELGRDISNNTHLTGVTICCDALNDHMMSFLFRGLTRSSIKRMALFDNRLSVAGVRTMVPFLENANNLRELDLSDNDLRSEGFNFILQALHNSTVEWLDCCNCGIESIEIDSDHIPRHLDVLSLSRNSISVDGCRGLTNLLLGGDTTLERLFLDRNNIDNEGVEILTNALQNNTSLTELNLSGNDGISKQGQLLLLKLVNDISSIEATLQSNHTLQSISVDPPDERDDQIQRYIRMATLINLSEAGSAKVIQTQLNSKRRAKLAKLQGVTSSVFSEIDPLHLPEVLALVGRHHGQGELFVALRSSIAGVITTVDKKQSLKEKSAYYRAKIVDYSDKIDEIKTEMVECRTKAEEVEAELAAIEAAEVHDEYTPRSRKRRRF